MMCCRQSVQRLMLSLHGVQQIRCRHGRNNTPTFWSMQTLHVMLLFSISFCFCNSSTLYNSSGSVTVASRLASVFGADVGELSSLPTAHCSSGLPILVIVSLLCVLSSSLKTISNSISESNDLPAKTYRNNIYNFVFKLRLLQFNQKFLASGL